ncbi:probable carboxylesterase 5 [Brachypodium distachyon]|nr:probable carboxylesterase 5 [Brachypodium distachyon]|eukprot:XP_010239290.1 probable carboxylesterase 5 [Brachypodium distachyon]
MKDVVAVDLSPFLREYKGGRVDRLLRSTFVPASEDAGANRGVTTRDAVIDAATGVSARLFLPSRTTTTSNNLLPVVMYIHGGSFCTESAFCRTYHNYARSLAANAGALVVSVEYRLAPEHPIPAPYDDAWAALQWVASFSDPWLAAHADPARLFVAGDSAGGNIVYNTAVRAAASMTSVVDIQGLVIVQPYFWGTERLPSEELAEDAGAVLPACLVDRAWPYVTAGQACNDDPRINPRDEDIASLACSRVLVAVAEKDMLRERGSRLAARLRDCRRPIGHDDDNDDDDNYDVTLVESEGEDHGFHLYSPLRATSKKLMESIVRFINQPLPLPVLPAAFLPEPHELRLLIGTCEEGKKKNKKSSARPILGLPSRPYMDVFGYGMAMKRWTGPSSCLMHPTTALGKVGQGNASSKTRHGLCLGRARPGQTYMGSFSAAGHGSSVIKNFF